MQIIIPMTGEGSRFVRAGYSRLKPFIKIHGSPMIKWVVSMFPGAEKNITFICRKEQADNNYYFKKSFDPLLRIQAYFLLITGKNWDQLMMF